MENLSSQFSLAIFQVINTHKSLRATILDKAEENIPIIIESSVGQCWLDTSKPLFIKKKNVSANNVLIFTLPEDT